jgi:chorismate dehydratase
MAEKIRIAAVQFLNGWPLTFGLKDREDVELRLGLPSVLGPMLARGEVDAALAPSIEYFRLSAAGAERIRAREGVQAGHAGFVALPVAAIGSRGTIGSVRLFGYAEQDRLRRVLLDSASRTSNALARIIVTRRFGCRPHFVMPDQVGPSPTRPPDAELVIGDRALATDRQDANWVRDLGDEWHRFVRLPFVYAFWMARADAPLARLADLLSEARDRGLAARETLADEGARTLGIPREVAHRYLLEQVRYAFGPKEREGLMAFYRMAAEEGLTPEGGRLSLAKP